MQGRSPTGYLREVRLGSTAPGRLLVLSAIKSHSQANYIAAAPSFGSEVQALDLLLKQPNHLRKQYIESATEIHLWCKWKCLRFPHWLMEMHVSYLPQRGVQLSHLVAE